MDSDVLNPQKPVVVDPEVRSYVYSLVTALGGSANDEAGRYVPGDDVLGCLRDLKKWLRFYDDKLNRMDVARCLAESNLVNGDLVPILALYGDCAETDKHRTRINLACLELLVPLTWPVEPHSQMTVNHHKHTPYLQHAQIAYKRGLLSQLSAPILRAIIRIGLPSMRTSRSERSSRDEGILKIVLYLFRNLAIINAPPNLAVEGDEDETSRSATINAFHHQDVFALLLTMCSNMGDEFSFQDVIILEILFHLVKGVDLKKLFMDDTERSVTRTDELKSLLRRENDMKRDYAKSAPTRHGRFGTMIWVKRDDAKLSTVSGQDVLKDDRTTYLKMDKTKKWSKPKPRREAFDLQSNNVDIRVHLTSEATKHFRTFVEEFLDSGFNPLFTHLRKAIEREADRLTETTSRQFFYVISWFLEAERERRARRRSARLQQRGSRVPEPDGFGLVASVLNQETFVTLNRYMQSCLDSKEWVELGAAIRCFTQILLTVQQMSESPLDEDQEIAENIQNRIFYEETTHDRILTILRNYKDQGFFYLDTCTELAHVFLRMLERYSKQNADMQIRSKRRRRKKAKEQDKDADTHNTAENEGYNSETEDMAEANRTATERSFDFKRFVSKFCNQKSVDTFVSLTEYYRELDAEQLKRAHRFFYRVAFKQDLSVLLFRVDVISLFYKMIKGPEPLESSKPQYKEWEELTRQIFKRMARKIEERPALITEMLFSKIPATLYYLEFGQEKQTMSSESKPAAELEVKPTAADTIDGKIRIVVSALILDGKDALVRWAIRVLESAASERKAWELEADARQAAPNSQAPASSSATSITVVPADESCRVAMYKNGRLRLLMSLSSFELLGDDVLGGSWIIPSSTSSQTLEETGNLIQKHLDNPAQEIDEADPRDLLRRRRVASAMASSYDAMENVDFGNDSEGDDNSDAALFPPNIRSKAASLEALKEQRRKRHKAKDGDENEDELDEEVLASRRLARQMNALARQQKIKSDLYVHASDEESDEEADKEFFAREEERRQAQDSRIREALATGILEVNGKKERIGGGKGKRKSTHNDNGRKKRVRSVTDSDDEDDLMTERPSALKLGVGPSSTPGEDDIVLGIHAESPAPTFFWTEEPLDKPKAHDASNGVADEMSDDDDDVPIARPTRRPRLMGGFVVDSDSD